MSGRTLFRVGFLALLISQSHLAPCLAQSDACSEAASDEAKTREGPNAVIDNVEFHGDNPFSESEWSAAVKLVKTSPFGGHQAIQDHDVLEYIATPIRDVLQDHGYFKAVVTLRVYFIRADADVLHYVLSVTIQAGQQYHLASMRFRPIDPDQPGLAFSENELRRQFELKNGDLLSTLKVRQGLDSLEKLYYSKGFIDMVPTPDQDVHEVQSRHDDSNAEEPSEAQVDPTIDLTIVIDEGKPYRITKIEVVGLTSDAVQQLQLPQVAGDVLNPNLWKDYFEKGASPLPKGAGEDRNMQVLRNTKYYTVSLVVDFRPCDSGPVLPVLYSEAASTDFPATPSEPRAKRARSEKALSETLTSGNLNAPDPK